MSRSKKRQVERIALADLAFSPASRPLGEAKKAARNAYEAAKERSGTSAPSVDRYWAETLVFAKGQSEGTAAEMFRRTEHLFALLIDRVGWML
jgi:hypothetical protein